MQGFASQATRWILPLVALLATPGSHADALLVAIVPDLPGPGPGDEAVGVWSDSPLDLDGWTLSDGEGAVPLSGHVAAGTTAWFTGNLTRWTLHGGPPASSWDPGALQLANDGDNVRLLDHGRAVDEMDWGEDPLDRSSPGLVLRRDRVDGAFSDTGSSADWSTPRLHRVGESTLDRPTFQADRLTLYSSPDSSFEVLTGLIAGAKERLHLHAYQVTSSGLVDALVAAKASRPGLDLQLLVEGSPVGLQAATRHEMAHALGRVQEAGGTVVLAGNGRYEFHHLKVLVADDAVAVQSENWVPNGVPEDPSWGNRGWGAVVHDAEAAGWFAAWMAADRAAWDTMPFDRDTFDPAYQEPARAAPRISGYSPVAPLEVDGPVAVTPLVSPDHTHDPRADPVAGLVHAAQSRVVVQQLDLTLEARNDLGWSSPDPLVAALEVAARRGVPVHAQAAAPFSSGDAGSRDALSVLHAAGADAAEWDHPFLATLHNKGLVVDDAVVLGSMNGNHHSRSANREAGLVIHSAAAADWFARLAAADRADQEPARDWGVIGDDLKGIPAVAAPWPMVMALVWVAALRPR